MEKRKIIIFIRIASLHDKNKILKIHNAIESIDCFNYVQLNFFIILDADLVSVIFITIFHYLIHKSIGFD